MLQSIISIVESDSSFNQFSSYIVLNRVELRTESNRLLGGQTVTVLECCRCVCRRIMYWFSSIRRVWEVKNVWLLRMIQSLLFILTTLLMHRHAVVLFVTSYRHCVNTDSWTRVQLTVWVAASTLLA